jgi:hypothetical protein
MKSAATPLFVWEVKSGLFTHEHLLEEAVKVCKEKGLELVVEGFSQNKGDAQSQLQEVNSKLSSLTRFQNAAKEIQHKHGFDITSDIQENVAKYAKSGSSSQFLPNLQENLHGKSIRKNSISIHLLSQLFDDYISFGGQTQESLEAHKAALNAQLSFLETLAKSQVTCTFGALTPENISAITKPTLAVTTNQDIAAITELVLGKNIDLIPYRLYAAKDKVPNQETSYRDNGVVQIDLSLVKPITFNKTFSHNLGQLLESKDKPATVMPKVVSDINYYLDGQPLKVRQLSTQVDAIAPLAANDNIMAGKGKTHLSTTLLRDNGVPHHIGIVGGTRTLILEAVNSEKNQALLKQVYYGIRAGQPWFGGVFGRQ